MKLNIVKAVALILAMISLLCFPVPTSAVSQGTDGTELEVMQPQNLEIQLGVDWAGVEFELKTDFGKYLGVITVDQDGVLRMEIGGSKNYILSCLNSTVEIPIPDETVPAADPSAETDPTAVTGEAETVPYESLLEETREGTLGGIPVKHLVLFGGGLILAIGALAIIHAYQKRNSSIFENDDDI